MRKWTRVPLVLALVLTASRLAAAEKRFDFSAYATNQLPPGMVSAIAGEGKPGDWRVLLDQVPAAPDPFNPGTNRMLLRSVIGQVARDSTDEHFPLVILTNDTFIDFTFSTKFKLVEGHTEQMAGIAFRIQDEKNFYVVRASGLGSSLYFYKFEKGQRSSPIGNTLHFDTGVWHELSVKCAGTKIQIYLDGKEAMPTLTDPSFASGKIGLFTKSDSVSYFADPVVTYTPKVPFAQRMVDDAIKLYPRVLGLEVYVPTGVTNGTKLIAGNDPKLLGQAGSPTEVQVLQQGRRQYKLVRGAAVVTMPLCDRNGDPVAAVRILLKPIVGQTEDNAFARALPVIKTMQERVAMAKSISD